MKNPFMWIRAVLIYLIGMLILQTGSSIYILTNIGSDPFTVFTQSIANQLNLSIGIANMIITGMFLFIIFLVDKKRIKVGTVLGMFLSGPFIDMMMTVLKDIPFDTFPYVLKAVCVIVACVIGTFGFSVLVCSNLGPNPNDLVPFMIQDASNIQYKWIKITLDVCYLMIGFILGGVVGFGTLVGAFLPGPIIQLYLSKLQKPISVFIEGNYETGNEKIIEG